MTRPLRVGDRVSATGTVTLVNESLGYVRVRFDEADSLVFDPDSLTIIAPAEPPVGSVVVKAGVAYQHEGTGGQYRWYSAARDYHVPWEDISDGEIIFNPGGAA